MTNDLRHRETCRLCGSRRLELAVPLNPSPIADAYIPASRLGQPQALYPLDLYLCRDCGHVQNLDIVNPELLFRDYLFTTGSSAGLVAHFRQYAADVMRSQRIKPGGLVVEIGSNDGTLLKFFKNEHGMRVLGIDPAREIARQATKSGVETLPEFFNAALASRIRKEYGGASVFCANNVFAHADDLEDIVRGVRDVLADDGVFVFEATYLVDFIDNLLFDTVYHEHVSYHSIEPLSRMFERLGLELIDVQRIPTKGGSIRGYAQRKPEGRRIAKPVVAGMITAERERGFDRVDLYRKYSACIDQRKAALREFIDVEMARGSLIAGYGASTTTTTLMWHFDLTRKLAFVADDNPKKHGLYCPGCHVPVVPSDEIYVRRPDVVVILAWQYAEPIIKRHQKYLDQGGRFVMPLTDLRVVGGR
jgi:SAM-dependent methyltransferase